MFRNVFESSVNILKIQVLALAGIISTYTINVIKDIFNL